MNTTRRSLATLFICLCSLSSLSTATAQQASSTNSQSPAPIVTATASNERVRYVSIGEVHQSRLQVFSPNGAQVYDSGLRLGNLIDWRLQNQQGQALPDGSYLSLLTITNFSGRLTQKYGTAVLEEGQVYLQHSSRADLSTAQASAMDASKQAENFTSIDRIGAAGLNRAALSETASNTNNGKTQIGGNTSSVMTPVDTPPDAVSGTGTPGTIVKWIDNIGGLGDSSLFEGPGGGIGLGTTDLSDVLIAGTDKFKIVDGPMTFSFRNASTGQGYFAIGSTVNGIKGFVGHTNTADGFTLGSFSNHKVTFRTNSLNRFTIDTAGNVGIGTPTPAARLDLGVNSGHILLGDAGCNPGFNGIGFGSSLSGCTNYSLLGNGIDTLINRPSGGSIDFREANTSQLTIRPGGNVGIGIATSARFSVYTTTANAGNNTAYFEAPNLGPHASHIHYGATGDWYIRSAAATGKVILQDTGGNVGIGTSAPAEKLSVAGTVQSTSGGFKFPDVTLQTTAVGNSYTTASTSGLVLLGFVDLPILHLNLPTGTYLLSATVQFNNNANFDGQNNNRNVECLFAGDQRYEASIAGLAGMVVSYHAVLNISSGGIDFKCGVAQFPQGSPSNVSVSRRRLTAVKIDNSIGVQ